MRLPYKYAVLLVLMPGITVFLIDATVVNVALAKLASVFGVQVATVQWAITGFALANGVATPMASFVEQRFTMKRVWLVALTLFTASSLLCGLAPAFWVLILARILQGFAGGMMLPLAIGTLFSAFPPNERGLALGTFAIPLVAGPALGPTLGGYIVTNLDWRLIFFINLPVGAAAVLLGYFLLRPGEAKPDTPFDAVGAILSSLAFGALLYGLSRVSQDGWSSLTVRGLLGFGATALFALVSWELQQAHPLIDVRLFLIPRFAIANVVGWVSTVGLFGAEFMLPLYLQNVRGLSAFETGLLLLPQGLAIAVGGPLAGRLVDLIGARTVVLVGFVLLAFNTWQLTQITLETPYATFTGLLVMRGFAFGASLQPTQLVALGSVPAHLRTQASSVNNAMRGVFQSLGVAMLATIVQTQTSIHTVTLGWQVTPDLVSRIAGLGAGAGAFAIAVRDVIAQSAVLAFADAYRVAFFVTCLAILAAMAMPGRGALKVDPAALMGE